MSSSVTVCGGTIWETKSGQGYLEPAVAGFVYRRNRISRRIFRILRRFWISGVGIFISRPQKKKEKIRQYIRDIRENRLRGGINSVVLNTECWRLYVAFVIS